MLTVYSSSVGKVRSPVTGAGWRRLNTVYSKDGSTFELATTAPLKKGPDIESYDWLRTSLFIYLFIFYELLFIVCEFVFGYCNFCPIALCDVTVTLKLQQEVCFSSNLLSFFTFMGFGCMRMHPFDLVEKKKVKSDVIHQLIYPQLWLSRSQVMAPWFPSPSFQLYCLKN